MFRCLALGLVVMETGSEALTGPKWGDDWTHGDVVHFEIKRANSMFRYTHYSIYSEHLADNSLSSSRGIK